MHRCRYLSWRHGNGNPPPLPLPLPLMGLGLPYRYSSALPRKQPTQARPTAAALQLSCSARPRTHRAYSEKREGDPRLRDLGKEIEDDYAKIRDHYATPRYPIVLAHGLLGFSELSLAGALIPPIHYWRGIREALEANGIEVFCATVPASASIEERAAKLGRDIAAMAGGKSVNVVAHSMGGLDARHMISRLRPAGVEVRSLVTVASPHRGSAFADHVLRAIGPRRLPTLYGIADRLGLGGGGAFAQLTQRYMAETFNPATADDPAVRYFSYGATITTPPLLSIFRLSHRVVTAVEGPNDGMVSVTSSRWGQYQGTLVGVSHLDLINWTNRLRWTLRKWMLGREPNFNAIAFYLNIADMLAKEGL